MSKVKASIVFCFINEALHAVNSCEVYYCSHYLSWPHVTCNMTTSHVIWHDIAFDMMTCDKKFYVTWHDMWQDIVCVMTWHDMWHNEMGHDMLHNMACHMIWCVMIWHVNKSDMIWHVTRHHLTCVKKFDQLFGQ